MSQPRGNVAVAVLYSNALRTETLGRVLTALQEGLGDGVTLEKSHDGELLVMAPPYMAGITGMTV